jgi:mono/diheme cytochrome c family protein
VKFKLNHLVICCFAASIATPALAQDAGADTFKSQCALCHGADGLGDTQIGKMLKAASFKDPAIIKTPDATLVAIIKSGKDKMPSFAGKLTDDQIKAVLAYIRTLEK